MSGWPSNYFNYFTEVEERFQKARGTALFLMSPLDWALVEAWKNAGVPLEAVLRGIDAAFEKWRTKKKRGQNVNSVAYCAQAVMIEAQAMAGVCASACRQGICCAIHSGSARGLSARLTREQIRNQAGLRNRCRGGATGVRRSAAVWRSGRSGAPLDRARGQDDRSRALAPDRRADFRKPAANSISNCAPIAAK